MLRLRYFKAAKQRHDFQFVGHQVKLPANHEIQAQLWYKFFWHCVPGVVYDTLRELFVRNDGPITPGE